MKMKKINQKRLEMKIENEISKWKWKLKFKIENEISFSLSLSIYIISLLSKNCQEKSFFQEKEKYCAAARECHPFRRQNIVKWLKINKRGDLRPQI